MPTPKFRFYAFEQDAFLEEYEALHRSNVQYFRQYLIDSSASLVIEETHYFDRDFLSEFSAFYSVSAKTIPNFCKRLHLFKSAVSEETFWQAVSGKKNEIDILQSNYLGFIVLRPLERAPFGRTVLKWYDVNKDNRNTECSRPYRAHIAGIKLTVTGLAWQQQDECVSTCATVSLWSLLHSSAFDDFHQVPTTAQITQFAHSAIPNGRMTFPSGGLTMEQIGEAIKSYGLSPCILTGDLDDSLLRSQTTFSKEKLANNLASFLRSGYPVLLFGFQTEKDSIGNRDSPMHAVCAVGFRDGIVLKQETEERWVWQDSELKTIYIHDDNLGPSVRFEIIEEEDSEDGCSYIKPVPPKYSTGPDIFSNIGRFYPSYLVAAVHQELRSKPETIIRTGSEIVDELCNFLEVELSEESSNSELVNKLKFILDRKLVLSTRFIKLTRFLGRELGRFFDGTDNELLGIVRKRLIEGVDPMSLYLGVIRIGIGNTPIIDILCDTTDPRLKPFCHMVYHPFVSALTEKYCETYSRDLGPLVQANRNL